MRRWHAVIGLSLIGAMSQARAEDSVLQQAYSSMQERLHRENTKKPALASRNAEAGRALASLCLACHSIIQGEPNNGSPSGRGYVGPNLFGVVGREIASLEGYEYSEGFKKLRGRKWTEQELYKYLRNPSSYAKGTKMRYEGVLDPQDRMDVIEFLKSLK